MTWTLVGLGNPGEEYMDTRHNTGRMALEFAAKKLGVGEWKANKATKATVVKGEIGKNAVVLVLPDTFMNKSGAAVSKYISAKGGSASGGKSKSEHMVVVYDDLDLPLSTIKLSYNRGSGGHKGVESIMRALKTKKFTRVRIGVSRATASGKIKKPSGEDEVIDFILTPFKVAEMIELKQVFKTVTEALETIVTEGPERAMNRFN